jgi:AcrR family transcriptional regulator
MAAQSRHKPAEPRVRAAARELYRKAILDAAERVFADSGVSAARVQDIASRAGLAVGTFYNHFEQKEDVLFALLDERMTGFLEAFMARPGDAVAFGEQLVARIARLVDYIASHRAFFQLASDHGLFGAGPAGGEALPGGRKIPHAGRYEKEILRVVEAGLAARVLTPLEPRVLAIHLRNTVRSAAQWSKSGAQVSSKKIAKTMVDLFLRGASERAVTAKKRQKKGEKARA